MKAYDKQLLRQQIRMMGQLQQLSWAVPQVVALRVARFASAGARPSARDRQEFTRMWAEKPVALGQAWLAMSQEALSMQQRWAAQMLQLSTQTLLDGLEPTRPRLSGLQQNWANQQLRCSLELGSCGLAPVRRRAVANARRLRRRA